jgi:nucleoside 2-deoxyribosyltransferase
MITFYLAHPFDSRKGIREWELKLEKKLKYITLNNPFYDGTERKDIMRIDKGKKEPYDVDPVAIVEGDLLSILTSDGIVAIVNTQENYPSYGTIQEIVYARMFHKPIYMLVVNGHEDHPWLQYHATKIFTTFEELENYLICLARVEREL